MELLDIVTRTPTPKPWQEGEKIPWNDPDFSRRMLQEHLNQEHDLASRRFQTIEQHIDWILKKLLGAEPGKILDLGCGPGFYTSRLAERGHTCRGIDFSPASISYARQTAAEKNLPCDYLLEDIRLADYGSGYDLAMLIYGELNTFRISDARLILDKAWRSLKPGGWLLLEVSTYTGTYELGHQLPTWFTAQSGLFSDRPHLVLHESFWDEDLRVATERYFVIEFDAPGGAGAVVHQMSASQQAYQQGELLQMLEAQNFREACVVQDFPALSGPKENFIFVKARK